VITWRAFLVFRRNILVFKKTWLTNIAFNFIEPILYLGAMGYGLGRLVQDIEGMSYIQFIAPGIIASSAMWATAAECTYDSFVRMNHQKIYHAIVATPINLDEVVVGELLFGAFKSVLYGTVILAVIWIFGLVQSPWALLVPVALIPAGLVVAELGMMWTGLVPNMDSFSYFFTLVITPMFLFSGVFFPVSGLGELPARIAASLPLYHTVSIIRSLVTGDISRALFVNLTWLLAYNFFFFWPPIYLMKKRLIG